jgi:hypothetical protein
MSINKFNSIQFNVSLVKTYIPTIYGDNPTRYANYILFYNLSYFMLFLKIVITGFDRPNEGDSSGHFRSIKSIRQHRP